MHESVFGVYDIRGKVGSEFILDDVYTLGRAIAYYCLQREPSVKTVALARDGRIHSAIIEEQLAQALLDSGLDVIFIGVCPTPVLYFSLHTLPVQAGLMVTASHNNREYNGIKLCVHKQALWGPHIQAIKELYKSRTCHKAPLQGVAQQYPMVARYSSWLADKFKDLRYLPLSLVIDCAHGATATVVPLLCDALAWPQVELLCSTLDGTFPEHDPDPVASANRAHVEQAVQAKRADLALAFDGDGDRMVPITASGIAISGDKMLLVYAQDILQKHPGALIIGDVKCSFMVERTLDEWGAPPSGHALIKHEIKQKQALFAGEMSGHFFFRDRYFGYDDGIYAALRLCQLLRQQNSTLDELVAQLPSSFSTDEIRIECPREIRSQLLQHVYAAFIARSDAQVSTIDGVLAQLPYGWGLVRNSHTQPVVCLRFESSTAEGLARVQEDFYAVLKQHIDISL